MANLLKGVGLASRVLLRGQAIWFVLFRRGIGGTLQNLGLELGRHGLKWANIGNSKPVALDSAFGRNLAETFIELGPSFVKLGQLLATRPDFLGEKIAEELKILFDRVPAMPFREVERILKREFGAGKIRTTFQSIDPEPLGSASIGQTHKAVLMDGTPVILKVQKKGVASQIQTDLILLEGLVTSAHLLYPKWQLKQMFDDFKHATLREVDYREEAKNIDRFHSNYSSLFSTSEVTFPRYYPELTTAKVLVLEPMHGKKVVELKAGTTVARKAAAKSMAAVLEQIFDHGFFHGDPHGGNLFFMEDSGNVGFIDLGLVGQLKGSDKQKFLKVIMAILKKDRSRLAKSLYELGTPSKKTKFEEFDKGVQKLLDEVKAKGVQDVKMDKLLNQLLTVARKNGIYIPNRYLMMIRSCLAIEGVARQLDPSINVVSIAIPIVTASLLKSYSPFRLFRRR